MRTPCTWVKYASTSPSPRALTLTSRKFLPRSQLAYRPSRPPSAGTRTPSAPHSSNSSANRWRSGRMRSAPTNWSQEVVAFAHTWFLPRWLAILVRPFPSRDEKKRGVAGRAHVRACAIASSRPSTPIPHPDTPPPKGKNQDQMHPSTLQKPISAPSHTHARSTESHTHTVRLHRGHRTVHGGCFRFIIDAWPVFLVNQRKDGLPSR